MAQRHSLQIPARAMKGARGSEKTSQDTVQRQITPVLSAGEDGEGVEGTRTHFAFL